MLGAGHSHPEDALRHARASLAYADAIGPGFLQWVWSLAARAAHNLGDAETISELLALLDSYPPGHLAPMLHAERDLVRARIAAREGDPAATEMLKCRDQQPA